MLAEPQARGSTPSRSYHARRAGVALECGSGFGLGPDEVLHLHLLELAHPEDEVARADSLRNDLPTWAMPNGSFLRDDCRTFLKLTYEPCAVSGRR